MTEPILPFALSPSYGATPSGLIFRLKNRRLRRASIRGNQGYLAVSLNERETIRTWYVHQIVAIVFHGEKPTPAHVVAHCDGVKTNNHYENVRWATRAENERDKIAHGTFNHIKPKTHCPAGHEYGGANSAFSKDGYQRCRACARARHHRIKGLR